MLKGFFKLTITPNYSHTKFKLPSHQVSDVAPLLCIEGLHTLNVSQCPLAKGAVGTLTGCANLVSLSLSQIPIDHTELAKLKGTG